MCGFVGIANLKDNISHLTNDLREMNDTLYQKDLCENEYYTEEHILLGNKSSNVEKGNQHLCIKYNDNIYTISYIGKLYNNLELKDDLVNNDFYFETNSDAELLLKGFIHYGCDIVNHLNGLFSFVIWNKAKQELFIARDHFGIKPLYYSIFNDSLLFATEVKAILKYPNFETKVSKKGICELVGLGPAHTPGNCIYENISELKPAHYAVFNKNGLYVNRYWKLKSKPHTDDFNTTCDKVKSLLDDAIGKQLVANKTLCTFLSGGLDSSIITTYASKYYKEKGLPPLNTYSVDYIDNDKNFVKSDFQPNSDKYYIDIMTNLLRNKSSCSIY